MRALALICAVGLLVVGCGESAGTQTASTPRVKLKLTLPDDGGTTFEDRVEVSGSVSPADSSVRIAGEDAEVDGGEFSAQVPLDPGGNVIDISASSPGRRPATEAVRVERDIRVLVPQLVGLEIDQAQSKLGETDLKAVEDQQGSWLDRVIPGTMYVCEVRPGEGTRVLPKSTVTLVTRRNC